MKLFADIGAVYADYLDKNLHDIQCKRVQCDEIWAFCYAKEKNVPDDLKGQFGYGAVWTWTVICADSKLIVSLLIGRRDLETATVFIKDLAVRMKNRIQLTTDGHSKKVENHIHSVAHHFMHYNFCRIHRTLRVTPAMEAGTTDHLWEIEDILNLLK